MNAIAAEHKAFFYRKQQELAENVVAHVAPAFEAGSRTVLVMTRPHLQYLNRRLSESDFDPDLLRTVCLLHEIDAEECLESFTISGVLNEALFQQEISAVLTKGSATFTHAYGEMVDVLCQRRRYDAAIELEHMWNRLALRHPFSLLCGYNVNALGKTSPDDFLQSVCHTHSLVQPPTNAPEFALIRQTIHSVAGYGPVRA